MSPNPRRMQTLLESAVASLLSPLMLLIIMPILIPIPTLSFAEASAMQRPRFQGPSAEFKTHRIVRPRVYHGRSKRQITTTRESDTEHTDVLSVGLELNGVNRILDLRLNRDLIPVGYKERYQLQGVFKTHIPSKVELCHYQGSIRELPGSWAAVSTCRGLKGVIFDGKSLHHIEPDEGLLHATHYLYKHSDRVTNSTCGYEGTPHHIADALNKINKNSRQKRALETIRGPFNANRQSRYVELVLVIDKNEYTSLEQNLTRVHHHCKDIANIINALYTPLNIFIALVGVEVWTDADEIYLLRSGDKTLTNFLQYRKEKLVKSIPNDNAQLLTKMQFDDGVVGKALKGPICTYEFSGGVSVDHSNVVGLVAATVAHEMGHNFGMEHDSTECVCPEERCIMAPSSGSSGPTHWSSCSLEYLALAFEHGMDYCLRNKPKRLFDSPICGNGFVEPGEQCDCGLVDNCDNPCCNSSICMLHTNASCATGSCCDLNTCKPKLAGTECRSAEQECDLPEYCTGQSEYCPTDVFKIDGESCSMGKAYCYQGNCRTHNDQCKLLWGPTGSSSDSLCYEMNDQGTKTGNCGYNRTGNNYVKCHDKNILCGMLHCKHLNERLEFGMESVAILSHSFLNSQGKIIACRSAMVDLGLNQVDPGLAPDGARCAQGKMCVNQKCVSVAELRTAFPSGQACPNNCGGNGVCNSLGHCHCNRGFQPPDCIQPGVGGSKDSGPAEDPNARSEYIMSLYIIFLGIIPIISLISFGVWYVRNNEGGSAKQWKKASSTGPLSTLSRSLGLRLGFDGSVPSHQSQQHQQQQQQRARLEAMTARIPVAKTVDSPNQTCRGIGVIDASLVTGHQDPACASLLPKVEQDDRFGQFKGFSIRPLAQPGTLERSETVSEEAAVLGSHSDYQRIVPVLPPPNIGSSARPLISSPVLATTTCASIELLSTPRLPTRPAPEPPGVTSVPATATNPTTNFSNATVTATISNITTTGSIASTSTVKKNYGLMVVGSNTASTVTRLGGTYTLPRSHKRKSGANAERRETLRSLEISEPIPQKEIQIPGVAIILKPEQNSGPERRAALARAQSLRDSKLTPRPNIHSFGSMRQAQGPARRPTSVPSNVRPTSPPPVPPVKSAGKDPAKSKDRPVSEFRQGYDDAYDDCMNLVADPSLGKIVEESPSNDNIYAVIEEGLPSSVGNNPSTLDANEYKVPRSLENEPSSDSMGLLSEIVSEISNRNFDSIYSTRTLRSETHCPDSNQFDPDPRSGTYVNSLEDRYKCSRESLYSNSSASFDCTPSSEVRAALSKNHGKVSDKKHEPRFTINKNLSTLEKRIKPVRTCVSPSKDSRLNSPDLVSSCSNGSSQSSESPDLLGRDNKTKTSTSLGRLKNNLVVPPKPLNLLGKTASKASPTTNVKKPMLPTMTSMSQMHPASGITSVLKREGIDSATPRTGSNITSLQEKFEHLEKGEESGGITKKKPQTPASSSSVTKK